MVGEGEEIDQLEVSKGIAVLDQVRRVTAPRCRVATQHQHSIRPPFDHASPKIRCHPRARRIGDGYGSRFEVALLIQKGLGRACDHSCVRQVSLRSCSRSSVRLDHGEVLATDRLSSRSEETDPAVEIHNSFVSGSDEGRDPFEEPRHEVAIPLEKRTYGYFESNRELHVDVLSSPSREDLG